MISFYRGVIAYLSLLTQIEECSILKESRTFVGLERILGKTVKQFWFTKTTETPDKRVYTSEYTVTVGHDVHVPTL